MNIKEIRAQQPEWANLDDQQIVNVLHQVYYQDMAPEAIAKAIGAQAPVAPVKPRGLGGIAADVGISALKGAIGVPEAAVGLLDIPTGGAVGKFLENEGGTIGFRPKEAKAMLDRGYTDQQKQAFKAVNDAQGVGDTFVAALQNPSVIGHSVVESLPSMGAGGVVGRGVLAVAPRVGAAVAGALGEGVVGGGSAAEQTRQQTPDGLLTPAQAGLSVASGAGTTAFSVLGGKVAKALGIHDVDTMLVGAVQNPAKAKGVVRRVLEGAMSEGILEELPQSIQEQVLQNAALGKPLDDGVDQAAVLGLLSGAAMGGGANVLGGGHQHAGAANDPSDTAVPAANSPTFALPAPTINVGADGTATTTDQRNSVLADRAARAGNIIEKGPLARAAETATGEVIDVEAKPAGALAKAAATINPQGVPSESAGDQAPADEVGQLLPGAGGAQLSDAAAAAAEPVVADGVAPGVLGQGPAVGADQAPEQRPEPAAVAPAPAAEPAAPQVFPTYEEADTFRKEQKARGATITALPVPTEGGFILAARGTPEYADGEKLRDERRAAKARADAGILDGDILNGKGAPFTIKLPATNAMKKAGPGHEVVAVKGGFVVRKSAAQPEVKSDQTQPATAPAEKAIEAPAPAPAPVQPRAEELAAGPSGSAAALRPAADAPAAPAAIADRGEVVEHTTGRGRVLRGVWRADLDEAQAKAIDPSTWSVKGKGWFIREKHLEQLPPLAAAEQSSHADSAPEAAPATEAAPIVDAKQQKADAEGALLKFFEKQAREGASKPMPGMSGKHTFQVGGAPFNKDSETTVSGPGLGAGLKIKHDALWKKAQANIAAERGAAPAPDAPDIEAQVAEMLAPGSKTESVTVPKGIEVPEAILRAQTDRRSDPGYTMKPTADGGVVLTKKKAPADAPAAAPAPAASANKIFTEDAAAAARARMKKKLGTVNSGIDPELLQDGITLAGYHIERGARTFAAYAKAMLEDMGEGIRPYLKQLYMALKFDPRATALEGLDGAAAVEAVDVDSIEPAAPAADTGGKENGNAARNVDRPGQGALEGAPSEDVRPAGEGGQAGEGADGRRGRDGGGDARADDAGRDLAGSVGAGSGDVSVPAGGTRAAAPDAKKPRLPSAPRADAGKVGLRPQQAGLNLETGPNEAPNAPPIAAPQIKAEDFTIEDDLGLGEGGQKTKYRNNVAAIRLLADLEASGRLATPEEQKVLAKYVGWGGLPQAFDPKNADWAKEHAELTSLLSPEDLADARRSTRYAHYTSRPIIVDGIYAALRRFGFSGGKTLEAGAGVGNFLGLMPADMRSAGRFTAIEREPFSSAIAKHLYPRQIVLREDFTQFKGNDAYFDAAVGNPPFASDPQTDQSGRKHLSGLSLHNYFFAKAVDMLREGGVMAQVVTNSFLDAKTDAARKYISDRTVFLGAIRLPNSAFAKNANTEVTTDIIFLQKRPDSEVGGKAARLDAKRWLNTGTYTDRQGKQVALNQYFIDNPHMMLGDFGAFGTMYGPDQPALVARAGQDTLAMLKESVGKLPEGVYRSIADTGSADKTKAAIVALKNPTVQEGGFFNEGGKLMQRLPDLGGEARGTEITPSTQWTEKTTLGESGFARIKALADMRSTLRGLIAAEMADDDKGMGQLRATLNQQYDAYRKEHGLINDPSTLRVFDDDPDFPLLASLEHNYTPGVGPAAAKRQGIKPTKSTAKKAPIFDRRVVAARTQVRKVETPADALAVSMAERGKLDAAYIGKLLSRDPDDVLRELSNGEKPALFRDPATDEYVLRDAYLSGNVRAKLAQAREAGMSANARALEEVQPEDVGASQIVARVGSPWVPESAYEDFAMMLFGEGTKARVRYMKFNSSFQVDITPANDVAWRTTFGTPKMNGGEILAALMNNRAIKVTYRDSEGKTHTDVEATDLANAKAQELRDKFGDWLFADGERAEKLVRAYNDTNNNYVTRVYDGSMMDFPGKVPDEIIQFRRHQRNAIARTVQDRTALYDHVVGAGKTFTVVASAMELKRTGLAAKNMVAVPNHLVKQWAADFYRLYPGANILTATKKDFEKANRRKFLAKIATGDWDAVVIAHSSFGFIKPAPEFEAAFNRREIETIVATINAVEEGDGDKPQKKRTIKQLEAAKEKLENRIKALRDKPMDDLLDFEQIGVDQLFVDEFHMYKNLMFSTKMQNVQGLGDAAGSQRAYDMYVKINQIFAKNGRDQGFVAATGTPVSNSLAEMYHMMRYLMPTAMKELGFESFDAWANTFASVEQVWMQKPSGDGFKASSRMSNFVNTPELLKMFDQVCDTVTMDDIKAAYREENDGAEFPIPKLKGDRRTPVSLDKTPAQEAYMQELAERAKILEARKGPPKKGEDNVLVIMGDGRKAAMDIRLVDLDRTEREPGGRIDRSSDAILERYRKYQAVKGTQLVFSDLGTPIKHAKAELKEYEALRARVALATDDVLASATLGNEAAMAIAEDAEAAQEELDNKGPDWLDAVKAAERGFSVYDDLRAALIEKGIPEAEIAFIHDYNTDDQKASLFRKVNAGEIRVLVGSTPKMGAGTNVQERLVALHHLDVPWRPSDVEQREGRIIRQGNALMKELADFEVEILAYVTKDTLDMRMWQVQETKLKMINQLRTRKVGREIDNAFEDLELSAGEMQAAATGNIDLLHEIQLRADVKKLEQRKRSFDANRNELETRRRRNAERLAELPAKIKKGEANAEQVNAYAQDAQARLDSFKATIDGKEYTDWREAAARLREIDESTVKTVDKAGNEVERAAPISVEINGETYTARAAMADAFAELRGDVDPIVWNVNGEDYRRRSKIGTAIRQGVIDAIADQTEKPVGTIAGYDVAVEGSMDKAGTVMMDVTLSKDGKTVATRDFHVQDTGKAPERVVSLVGGMLHSIPSDHNYLKRQLAQAQKEQADLAETDDMGEWPDQPKLEQARAKHKEVLGRLAGKAPGGAAPEAAPAFSLGNGSGMSVTGVKRAVDAMVSQWTNPPPIVIAASMSDPEVPEAVRRHNAGQNAQGAEGEPEAFFYKGTVYILADKMTTEEDVARVLFHEALGHFGLRGVFGENLKPILQQLAAMRRGDVAEKARQYGLDMNNERDRLMAAEEVLAEMAQTHPEAGFVQRAIAAIRTWLRAHVPMFKGLELTDGEILRNYILPARDWVERGQASQAPSTETIAYSKEPAAGAAALAELSKADDLFALPKSDKTTVEGIAADNDPGIKVRKLPPFAGRTDYQLTAPDGMTARLMVREPNPYGPSLYGYDVLDGEMNGQLTERPGENPEDVPPTGDVWIDVSLLDRGGSSFGSEVYNIAATYAHNTGRIFIGDPAGLSDHALRRRLEQMISSALKFGTTAHLAPHPDQVRGGKGVPGLKWVYGDDVGNVERMIAASVKGMDNAYPNSKRITFDAANGTFQRTDTGRALSRGQLAAGLGESDADGSAARGRMAEAGESGWRTVARTAVFRALARGEGGAGARSDGRPNELLGGLLRHATGLGSNAPRERIFYSRSQAAGGGIQGDEDGARATGRTAQAGASGPVPGATGATRTGLNDTRDWRAKANDLASDLFKSPGVVGWWHKTVGTMHDLAQRSPAFKRVYDAVQTFLQDVSYYATEAADLAPRILPKLETLRDLKKGALSAEDTKGLSRPVFEGTLVWGRDEAGRLVKMEDLQKRYEALSTEQKAQMLLRKRIVTPEQLQRWQASKIDVYEGAVRNRFEAEFLKPGVVFTDAELKATFGSTPQHIGLYKEFRAAIDKSLNRLGVAEMLRFGGKDTAALRDMVLDAPTAADASILLRDHLMALADEQPERRDVLMDTANKMVEKGDKIQALIDRGYAPLSRYGQYTLDVVDANGERVYFGMFEGRLERGAMARKMRENFPDATINQGTVSEQGYKLFNGITPETLELFGEMVGLESDGDDVQHQMFQQYLKLAKSNRSAMKRLIERKGIAGFNEDAGRVLAGFVYSNARLTSQNLHAGEIAQATQDIPKSEGQLKDMAVKLSDYVRNPQEEAQQIRGMLFAQYIGGSIASAMVNMTQPFAVTMPYLSQYGGIAKSAARMKQAVADVIKKTTGDANLDAALKHAEAEGIVAPQEVHQLLAQARGQGALKAGDGTRLGDARAMAGNVASKVMVAWGKPFSLAEQFNRRVTFIAAYRTAVEQGIPHPAKFAEQAIADTQFVYNKGNKPQWARGAVGGVVFTFKQYSISYVELLHRMATQGGPEGKKAALFALAMLFLMSGAGGVPFMSDAEDVVDGIMQRLGYSFSTKQARRQFLIDTLGAGAAEFVERGVSGVPGVPIDVAGRLGMGNLIPGTGLLVKKQDHTKDVTELLGPAADLVQRGYQGAGMVLDGKPVQGVVGMLPKAAENVRKGLEVMVEGQYKDAKGRKVMDATPTEGLVKMLGFQPAAVAQESERAFTTQTMVSQNRMVKQDFAADMAQAVYEKDAAAQQAVRDEVREWNRKNPHSPMTIDMAGVRRRVMAMRQDRATRLAHAAPKAIRADVKAQLQEGAN